MAHHVIYIYIIEGCQHSILRSVWYAIDAFALNNFFFLKKKGWFNSHKVKVQKLRWECLYHITLSFYVLLFYAEQEFQLDKITWASFFLRSQRRKAKLLEWWVIWSDGKWSHVFHDEEKEIIHVEVQITELFIIMTLYMYIYPWASNKSWPFNYVSIDIKSENGIYFLQF